MGGSRSWARRGGAMTWGGRRLALRALVALGAAATARGGAETVPGGAAAAAAAVALPVAVVTGANTGIGYHAAGQLAAKGYHVVLACRSQARADDALRRMRGQYGKDISAEVRLLDLASFASVRRFAEGLAAALQGSGRSLGVLLCNAGLNSQSAPREPGQQLTEDGVDLLYQSNFLSHLLLMLLLAPLLRAARGRVVSVSSVLHRGAPVEYLPLARTERDPYVSLYSFSKLAQIAITMELHRRFGGEDGVAFHCVNPGGVASDIWRDYPPWQRWAFWAVFASPARAARTVVRACVCDEGSPPATPAMWNGYLGADKAEVFEYWSPWSAGDRLVQSVPSSAALDQAFASRLWEESIASLRAAGAEPTGL